MRNSRLLASAILTLTLLIPALSHGSSAVVAHVLTVGAYGNGNVYIALDQTIDEPGCAIAYVELPANGPAVKAVLATATLAVATGATITVKTDSCYNGSPSFSGARPAWFVVNKH